MVPFRAKGEIAEWRLIYERLLETAEFGQVITYVELDEVLGRRFIDNRSPLYRAREDLGSIRKRWLEPVPGVGYRVTEPGDHVRVSVSHRRKSQRQVSIAVKVPFEVERLEDLVAAFQLQADGVCLFQEALAA